MPGRIVHIYSSGALTREPGSSYAARTARLAALFVHRRRVSQVVKASPRRLALFHEISGYGKTVKTARNRGMMRTKEFVASIHRDAEVAKLRGLAGQY